MKDMEPLHQPIIPYSLVSLLVLCVLLSVSYGEVGEDTAIKPSDVAWINSLFYLPKEVRVRKEYRMLSEQERNDYHTAILKLKQDTSVTPNKYDLFVSMHGRRSARNSAHKGTGFLGWHRIFTLLFENALREKMPNVTVPYWDCTLDAVLPLPRKSSIWSEDFMGNGDGYVVIGVFKSWTTQIGKLYRTVGITEGPLADRNITRLLEHVHIGNISLPGMPIKSIEHVLEETHNRVHRWVGGEMREIETAGEDPVFYIYHAFINYIWEVFRANQRAHGIDPETDWALYYGQTRHHKYSPMGLGNMMAFDGSNELFAENIVHTQRPWCSRQQTDCKSPLLYCNVTVEKCVPWTIKEYHDIKSAASTKNITFSAEAASFILLKISKGYEELHGPKTVPKTTTQRNVDDSHEHHHHHHDVTDIPDSDNTPDSDEHSGHSHGHRHILNVLKSALNGYIPIVILACLVTVRVLFCICSKCCSERKKRVKGTCRKYNMDGIANLNYLEDNGKLEEHVPNENRSDNIYTITVSCPDTSTVGSSTYVRFSRYVIGKSGSKNKSQGIKCEETMIAKQIENGGNEVQQLELKHQTESAIGNGVSMHNVSTKPEDDYMDMTFALTESEGDVQNTSDIFERVANVSDIDGEDNEARMDSIENENFDLPLTTTENSFAFLDDYDNVYFTREPEKENPSGEVEDTEREFDDENVDKSVCDYLSSDHI